jgi:WD40 repeat protein
MKTLTSFLRQSLKVHITLICIACIPHIAFAIEPIAAIGKPPPRQHAFLNNDTIVRVIPRHIQIVDADTGDVINEFGNLTSFYSDVVFSPNTSHLAILNSSHETRKTNVEIWDTNTQEKISEWEVESGINDIAAFSPIAPLFALSSNNQIHLWNWETDEFVGTMTDERRQWEGCYFYQYPDGGGTSICSGSPRDHGMVFTLDGQHLIVASKRPDLELWNVETRKLEGHFEGHTGSWVDGVAISPDGKRIASFERIAATIYVWDIETRQLLWKAKSGVGRILKIIFSPDSQHLYVATQTGKLSKSGANPWEGWDDKVRVWDVQSGKQIDMFSTEFRSLNAITFSPDGKTALLNYLDAEVLWDIENKRQHDVSTDFVSPWFSKVVLSPDGKSLISATSHFIKTWDVASQQMQLLIPAEDYKFETYAFSPNSQTFAVGKDPWIELRDIHSGKIETRFPHYIAGIQQIAFSPSGRWIAAADDFRRLVILDVKNPEKIQRVDIKIEEFSPSFRYIAFSENDEYLAASCRTGKNNTYKYWILLWKREDQRFIFQYASQVPRLYSSPTFTRRKNGSTVLAASEYKEIQIWEVLENRLQHLTTLDGDGPMQFSLDSRYLFAKRNGDFQVWDWQKSRPIKHSSSIENFVSLSQDGSVLVSYDSVSMGRYLIYDLKDMLSLLPYPVEPKGKQFVTLGQIKRNQLLQNFPNPFNPETWIPFRLADKSNVTIRIYTPTGKLVRSISPGTMSAGDYSSQSQAIHWDGRNDAGETVSSGVYLYTINAGDFSATRKMLIRK